jgi:diadenosine tetraphosphate (Ap4A) HIT family hydrolase
MDPLTCPFCNPRKEEIVLANSLCYAGYDRYPVSPGHLLLIPFRHLAGLFDAELAALLSLVRDANGLLDDRSYSFSARRSRTSLERTGRYLSTTPQTTSSDTLAYP